MTMRTQTFSGIRWTTFSAIIRTAMQFGQVAVLARLLSPADYGEMAVLVAIMAFVGIFADAGISNAIIHFQDISHQQLSSLYWLNVGVSAVLAALLALVSSWVAQWYHLPVLQNLVLIAAASLVLGAIGQLLRITAQKELRFAALAKVDMLAALCGTVVAVALAWYGVGVYALAVGGLAGAAAGSALAWLMLARGWRPQYRLRFGEIAPFLKFGGYMIGNNVANTFNSQIDVLLGVRLVGVQAMGLYTMPKNLSLQVQMVINPIVTQVGMPVMAKAQGDRPLLKRVYLQTMRMTSSVNFPVYVALALFAPEVVNVLLGTKWQQAVPLLQSFAVWGLLRSTGNPVGSLLIATGKAELSFKWNVALLVLIAPSIWFGSSYGVQGIACVMTGLMALLFVPAWYFLVRPSCGAGLCEYCIQMAMPLALAILAGGVAFGVIWPIENVLMRLGIGLVVGGLVYVGLSWRFNRVWIAAMIEALHLQDRAGLNIKSL